MAHGVGKGDVVALMMPNRPEYLAAWLGIARAGGVIALLNTNLSGHGARALHQHRQAEARHRRRRADRGLPHRRAASRRGAALLVPRRRRRRATSGSTRSSTRCPTRRSPTSDLPRLTIEDKCLYVYTSGTTGLPKAANINHYRVQSIMFGFNGAMRMRPTTASMSACRCITRRAACSAPARR